MKRGVSVAAARRLLVALPGMVEGRSYGLPSFLLNGRFFARFRDDDTVLVLKIESIDGRDILMQLDPASFFFTDHYRDYPAVLIRLAEVAPSILTDVVTEAWRHAAAAAPARHRATRRSPRKRSRGG